MRICLDAGHGIGAVGGTGGEHELVLRYVLELREELLSRGHSVVLTRSGSRDVSFPHRVKVANDFDAKCFISMHANAASNITANGVWVIHMKGSHEGQSLAGDVFAWLRRIPGIEDDDVEDEVYADRTGWTGGRGLYVLRNTRMPAILIELGFLTNRLDREQLTDPATIDPVVQAIANGIDEWAGISVEDREDPSPIIPDPPHIIGSVEDAYDPTPLPVDSDPIELAKRATTFSGNVVWTQELDDFWRDILDGPMPPVGFRCNGCTASFDKLPISKYSMLPACVPHDYHYAGLVPGMSRWWGDTYFMTNGYRALRTQGYNPIMAGAITTAYFTGAKVGGHFGHFTAPPEE